jgi:DNA-binding transcriptional regulator YhcF (GntR family)
MIRIWLSRGVSIPLREQLTAQLILGVLSGRLAPGERLPSVRDLARRLKLHANTISAAYRDLARRGWVSRRRGSGVFVRELRIPGSGGGVDAFAREWAEQGLARGYSLEAMQSALARLSSDPAPRRFLVIDPEEALAEILAAEIGEATGSPPAFAPFETAAPAPGTCLLVSEAHRSRCSELFPGVEMRAIRLRSMQEVLAGRRRSDSLRTRSSTAPPSKPAGARVSTPATSSPPTWLRPPRCPPRSVRTSSAWSPPIS